MNSTNKVNKSTIAFNLRPNSPESLNLPSIKTPSLKHRDFHFQDEGFMVNSGRINKVKNEKMKQTIHSCIIPLICLHPITKEQFLSTAFLISKDIAVTSAHNLYNKNYNKYYQEIKLCPTISGQDKKNYHISTFFVPNEFIMQTQPKRTNLFDYAFIKLNEPINLPAYLLLTTNFNNMKQILAIYGYPGSKLLHQNNVRKAWQHGIEGQNDTILDKDDQELKRLKYVLTTQKGQSGSPVIIGVGQRNRVVAIHKGFDRQIQFNYGRLITKDLLLNLEIWRTQNRGSLYSCSDYSTGAIYNFGEVQKDLIDPYLRLRAEKIAAENQFKVQFMTPSTFSSHFLPISKNNQKNNNQNRYQGRRRSQLDIMEQSQMTLEAQKKQKKDSLNKGNKKQSKRVIAYNYSKIFLQVPLKNQKVFFWNNQTQYAYMFNIMNRTATKKSSNGIFQIVSQQPVASVSRTIFKVHMYSKTIVLGLTKASNIKLPSSGEQKMKGSISFSTDYVMKKGKIIINGEVRKEKSSLYVKHTTTLTIEINMNCKVATFYTQTSKKYSYDLPPQLYKEEWFVFAGLHQEGDRIEVMK